jgi:hypothetical protein
MAVIGATVIALTILAILEPTLWLLTTRSGRSDSSSATPAATPAVGAGWLARLRVQWDRTPSRAIVRAEPTPNRSFWSPFPQAGQFRTATPESASIRSLTLGIGCHAALRSLVAINERDPP